MIIAIANQKGGQGKTTTAQAIATKATSDGKKSLAIDLDPQGNLTFSIGEFFCSDIFVRVFGTAFSQAFDKPLQLEKNEI